MSNRLCTFGSAKKQQTLDSVMKSRMWAQVFFVSAVVVSNCWAASGEKRPYLESRVRNYIFA